jgi:hypothetical protein
MGISPIFSLLIPTFSFPAAPPKLALDLRRNWNAPLPLRRVHSFGIELDARSFSAQERSTSELLRTL